ncbi:MAG TPA: nitroreductase family protein [Ktedonobacterales bacterium]|jgi:nitroreductase|nr:nitroreductase family protein [Ktedonobacterales bacterium]
MEFSEVVRKRRMVRHFTNEPIAPEVMARILDLARRAPSAGFTQGQSFVVVTQPETRRAIARICDEQEYVASGFDPFVSEAPALVVPCVSEAAYHRRYQEADKVDEQGQEGEWPVPYWFMDIGCSVMALLLAVVNEGLAAGFVGAPTIERVAELRRLLGIPAEVTPVGVVPIGHPALDQRSPSLKRGRKPVSDFAHYERW